MLKKGERVTFEKKLFSLGGRHLYCRTTGFDKTLIQKNPGYFEHESKAWRKRGWLDKSCRKINEEMNLPTTST